MILLLIGLFFFGYNIGHPISIDHGASSTLFKDNDFQDEYEDKYYYDDFAKSGISDDEYSNEPHWIDDNDYFEPHYDNDYIKVPHEEKDLYSGYDDTKEILIETTEHDYDDKDDGYYNNYDKYVQDYDTGYDSRIENKGNREIHDDIEKYNHKHKYEEKYKSKAYGKTHLDKIPHVKHRKKYDLYRENEKEYKLKLKDHRDKFESINYLYPKYDEYGEVIINHATKSYMKDIPSKHLKPYGKDNSHTKPLIIFGPVTLQIPEIHFKL